VFLTEKLVFYAKGISSQKKLICTSLSIFNSGFGAGNVRINSRK